MIEISHSKYSKTWNLKFCCYKLWWKKIPLNYDRIRLSFTWCTLYWSWSYSKRSCNQRFKISKRNSTFISSLKRTSNCRYWLCRCSLKNRRNHCLFNMLHYCWRKWMGHWLRASNKTCETNRMWLWNWRTRVKKLLRVTFPSQLNSHKMSLPPCS